MQGCTAQHDGQGSQAAVLEESTGIENATSLLNKQVDQQQRQGMHQPQQEVHQHEQQQQQQQEAAVVVEQQQAQQQVSHSYNPIQWYCAARLRQAESWLEDERHAVAQAERGASLWQYVAQNATKQVCVVCSCTHYCTGHSCVAAI